MHRRGGPNVAIAFDPGGPLTAQLRAVESPGGPVSGGDRRKRDSIKDYYNIPLPFNMEKFAGEMPGGLVRCHGVAFLHLVLVL